MTRWWHTTNTHILLFLLLMVLILGTGTGVLTHRLVDHQTQQQQLQQQLDNKLTLYLALRSQLGYGGLIHNFKNHVLRGSHDYRVSHYASAVQENFAALEHLIRQYRQLPGISSEESQALNQLEATINQYQQKMVILTEATQTPDYDIRSLDRQVLVDDRPAIDSLRTLGQQLTHHNQQEQEKLSHHLFSQLLWSLVIITLLVLALLALTFELLVRRGLLLPIEHFAETLAEAAMHGEAHLTPPTGNNPTLQHLGQQFLLLLQAIRNRTQMLQTFKSALDQQHTHLMLVNEQHKVTYLNQTTAAWLASIGLQPNQLIGARLETLLNQDDALIHWHQSPNQPQTLTLMLAEHRHPVRIIPLLQGDEQRNGWLLEWSPTP